MALEVRRRRGRAGSTRATPSAKATGGQGYSWSNIETIYAVYVTYRCIR
ncbi:hypothetical protein Tharo_1249 [Thauera aromatica K172]|uniref:Uncharacterized protein n=1 Tax=Thauera aromatica K172 TaxID=44139 RepID=A0A2R4BLI1_THAAR|nr:hypothetical protein Tharo_1249 [Thauera aromatica K172]